MPVSIRGTAGGSVTLSSGAAAADTTLTLPNTTGTVALTASPTFTGTLTATTITSPASTALTIQSAGTTAMTVDTSQNVGIGTTSPTTKLDVNGTVRSKTSTGGVINMDSTTTGTANTIGSYANAGAAFADLNYSAAQHLWLVSGSEKMRIDTSGNLLVNTSSAYSAVTKLYVVGNSTSNWMSGFNDTRTDGGSSAGLIGFFRSGTTVGGIQTSTTSTTYFTTSDYRLKENVEPMTNGLATINALNPVTYDWASDKSRGEGFIAHELAGVIPLAITGEKDAVNEDGSIKPQGVDYSKIVVHLVAACQELSAKNDALESRLAALEAK